jgi:type II secretory pathway pseudopilin PulG
VIPQFTSASEAARASSMVTQLQTLRSQFELYQIQHNGDYPLLATLGSGTPDDWSGMTSKTDISGAAGSDYGPYLQQAPVNAFTNGTNLASDNSADWEYNEATGAVRAVVPLSKITQLNLSDKDVVAQ